MSVTMLGDLLSFAVSWGGQPELQQVGCCNITARDVPATEWGMSNGS